jgi:hypothetical protein
MVHDVLGKIKDELQADVKDPIVGKKSSNYH